MLTEIEKKVLASIQGDLPVIERPYLEIAQKIGISEDEVLKIMQDLCDRGVIRRFGATLRHQKSGYKANAMVAWKVDETIVLEVGNKMATSEHVSHCYRRDPKEDWPYNLYTMIHAASKSGCREIASGLSEKTSIKEYSILFSNRELKKTSMQYFQDDD